MKTHDALPQETGEPDDASRTPAGVLSRTARKHSIIAKILIIAFLLLLLLWPILMFRALVNEREQRRGEAESEIMQSWGGQITVAGPILSVPYIGRTVDANGKSVETVEMAHFLPDTLRIEGTLLPEKRNRGMYDVTVYGASVNVSGRFRAPDFSGWRVTPGDILWDQAALSVELPDMRALQDRVPLSWGEQRGEFHSSKSGAGLFAGEMRASVAGVSAKAWPSPEGGIPFSFHLSLHGGDSISFLPLGDETVVRINSPWTSPNFNGAYLPGRRSISPQGFEAEWRVISMTRAYPQRWKSSLIEPSSLLSTSFGVSLMTPNDTYQKVTRALKYAVLFLLLPFCTLFFFEVFARQRIHPLQYLLVGLGDCVFYLLLLSLAEHISFAVAYAAAAAACASLISLYTVAVVRSAKGFLMLPVVAGSYGFLAVVLYSEDSALLIGSLGLFVLLSLLMYLTRKVDWYTPAAPGKS
ncbi:MAG TPA: cell envelope integrity protein CreD [Spirochaetia bacterium]|nr:cell envelope integrity protein CreD [Spirochaetia bacterium]